MKKVLIVDDEIDVTEILTVWLKDSGFVCDIAHDVDSAMKLLQQNYYCFVFCDLKMPRKNGMVLLQYIHNSFPSLIRKSILITGTILDSDVADFVERKGVFILKKPFV